MGPHDDEPQIEHEGDGGTPAAEAAPSTEAGGAPDDALLLTDRGSGAAGGRRRRAMAMSALALLAVVVAGGWAAASVLRADTVTVDFAVPDAPRLTASGPGQTVHRVDPSRSSISYEIEENLAGRTATAVGTTKGIAGDVLVDDDDPRNSQVGELVVNVEQLTSDQSLRDERIRDDYLSSSRYPLARVRTTEIRGLPDRITDGVDHEVTLVADLTVKETTRPVEITATVRREVGELHITGSTRTKLSEFGVGPISMIGLVSTGDDVTLRFDLWAPDAADVRVASVEAKQVAFKTAGDGDPRFSQVVQPVLERSCASCHQPGAAGSGAWELATAGDAARVADGLGLAVESRYMPPWLASDQGVPLNHSPVLSQSDIDAVVGWAKAGAPLDIDPTTRITATKDAAPQIRRDVDMRMPEPYTGSPSKENDYRCFTLDPKLTEAKAITAYEFTPDQLPIVHHGLVYRVAAKDRAVLDEAERRDPLPGWECYGTINARAKNDLVMGWAPGQPATRMPDGSGYHLQAGDLLVMQVHYHVTEDPPPDRTGFTVELGAGPASDYDPIEPVNYLAPAEIPCKPGATAPRCDRETEMKVVFEKYGAEGTGIANGLHSLCRTKPEQLAKLDEHGIARTSCDRRALAEGQVVGVHGHMHEIGKTFRMTLNPGTPEEKVLLDIPRWDFDWQLNYQPTEHIEIKRGDVIRVECSWDRNLVKPDQEEHYITWSEGTDDEMCYSVLTTRERKPTG